MLEQLRAWLNGSREYYSGVIIYSKVGDNEALLKLFSKGKTDYCHQRLKDELMRICLELKSQHADTSSSRHHSGRDNKNAEQADAGYEHSKEQRVLSSPANPELYQTCKAEADKTYKEIMNLRAQLFALARADDFTDPNTPDKIEQRSRMAVNVADGFKTVSQLYDRAAYVKLHGRLPNDIDQEDDELNADDLPDHLVKQTLDNTRKNYNKMKKREATPERVVLLQKHEANIKKLDARWRLLKPTS